MTHPERLGGIEEQVFGRFVARQLTPLIGSTIVTDAQSLMSDSAAQDIRALLDERLAIVFPGVDLSEAEQVRFAQSLGPFGNAERGGILKVSHNPAVNPDPTIADFQRASLTWHFDGYTGGIPDYATILSARVLPESGGATEIANTVAAFADLPETERNFLESLHVVHDTETAMRSVNTSPSDEQLLRWKKPGQWLFPLVWTSRTGRKSLLIGHSASHVQGMGVCEGRALLSRLCEWATQPQYMYSHRWGSGDLLLWDNAGTLHRAASYSANSGRLLDRTAVLGDNGLAGRPVLAVSAGNPRP